MMENKMLFLLVCGCVLFGASLIIQAKQAASSTTQSTEIAQQISNSGIIVAVDIQAKTIQIGEANYGIIDGVQVYSQSNQLISQRALAPGQKVEFAVAPQPLDQKNNSPLPAEVITFIRILSGYNENANKS
jgi:hypothetical protein